MIGSNNSAKRVNLNWVDRLKRVQRFPDGLPNKDSTGERSSETSQPEDESRCNASGARAFYLALLSAESHLSFCVKSVVSQTAPGFNCAANHSKALQ